MADRKRIFHGTRAFPCEITQGLRYSPDGTTDKGSREEKTLSAATAAACLEGVTTYLVTVSDPHATFWTICQVPTATHSDGMGPETSRCIS
jgi:hypothetical protein